MVLNISSIISLTAFVFYLILLVIIIRQNYGNKLYLSFSVYLFSMLVWSFGSFMIFADFGWMTTLFWNKFMVVGSLAMPIAFFGFVQAFRNVDKYSLVILGWLLYAISLIVNFGDGLVVEAWLEEATLHNEYGWGISLSSASWLFFIVVSAIALFYEKYTSESDYYENRVKYLLITVGLIFVGSLTNATGLQIFPIDITFNAVAAFIITYAILRHQLLDINLVVRKGLLYSIPTIIIGAGYFLLISLAISLFENLSESGLFLLSFIVAILAAIVAQPVRDKAQSWIDKVFFREKYDTTFMIQRISEAAASELDINRLVNLILDEITKTFHVNEASFFLVRDDTGDYGLFATKNITHDQSINLAKDHPIIYQLSTHPRGLSKHELDVLPQFKAIWKKEMHDLESLAAELFIPIIVQKELIGLIALGKKLSENSYSSDDLITLTTLSNQIGVAIEKGRLFVQVRRELSERIRAEERLQQQIQRMSALHTIDTTINSSVNLQVTLQVILDVVTNQLNVDAAAVLLYDENSQKLEYISSRGFRTSALQHTRLTLGEGLAGRAAINQTIIHVPNLRKRQTSLNSSPLILEESFVTYYGAPLIAKGSIKGVLEIFHRAEHKSDPDWLEFLKTLAAETALAVDNSGMFNDLQKSNMELVQAYNTTLEGWARALELRDQETEGHTRRVAEMTIELARSLDIKETEIVHIHRGAILHDIGKMGIPDQILLKPGPLTEAEWTIMRKHPVYAFDLLATIPFLRQSLDIPHYHHEKWDGGGYPLGLKGEQIPLAARIFCLVDVWDALCSDRPYRSAWEVTRVMEYIRDQSGSHFDPRVVSAFIQLMDQKPYIFLNHAPNWVRRDGVFTTD